MAYNTMKEKDKDLLAGRKSDTGVASAAEVEAMRQMPHIVMIGSTGSGKSTLGNWLENHSRPVSTEAEEGLRALRQRALVLEDEVRALTKKDPRDRDAEERAYDEFKAAQERWRQRQKELGQPFAVGHGGECQWERGVSRPSLICILSRKA
jgi:ATPase subunit of ABC transporter with duplicated ATPase domains